MSLDFILLKTHGKPLSMEEVEQDTSFKAADYRALAERLFGPATWNGESGIAMHDDMSFELLPSDVSLSVTARGSGDTVAYMDEVAVRAGLEGIVTIDVQGSELLLPFSD